MKFALAAFIAAAASAASLTNQHKFMKYLVEQGKSYLTAEEFAARFDLFEKTEQMINEHNSSQDGYVLAHNKFSDMTDMEKMRYKGHRETGDEDPILVELDDSSTPTSIDWRSKGGVNRVQDQGSCGSCWTFSAVAALEGAHFVSSGKLLKFAEQQLVDCASSDGCGGGSSKSAFGYYEKHYAIKQSDYPYHARDGTCQYNNAPHTNVEVSTYYSLSNQTSSQLKAAIAKTVVSVSIEADNSFMSYSSGIYKDLKCGTHHNHAVSLVGYGTSNGQEYFILRNSWGTSWGESGYMRMANIGDGPGICGVNTNGSYPVSN